MATVMMLVMAMAMGPKRAQTRFLQFSLFAPSTKMAARTSLEHHGSSFRTAFRAERGCSDENGGNDG
eukprot:12803407-Alexandrium_andersonii.AAC.1